MNTGHCRGVLACCLHFSHWGENEVLKVAECQQVHNSWRKFVVAHCWQQSSGVWYRLSCRVRPFSPSFLVLFVALAFVFCTFDVFSASFSINTFLLPSNTNVPASSVPPQPHSPLTHSCCHRILMCHAPSYPGLLTPAFIVCSTNVGEGLVKTESCAVTYLDMWRSGTFLLYSCKASFWTQEKLSRLSDVEHSVVLRSVFSISSALTYLQFFRECATPPHVQVHHCRPSPTLVLQVTNAGVRRPGYEATWIQVQTDWYVTLQVPDLWYQYGVW